MKRLANEKFIHELDSMIFEAIEQRGEILFGGNRIDRTGYYFELNIIRNENRNTPVLQPELFEFKAIIVPLETKGEAVDLANNTDICLVSYIYYCSRDILNYFANELEFGEVHLNGFVFGIFLPHGGIKNR